MIEISRVQSESLRHELAPVLDTFARARSRRRLQRMPLYRAHAASIDAVLAGCEHASFRDDEASRDAHATENHLEGFTRIVAWNVERGRCFDGVLHHLRTHPLLASADVWLLSEVDSGMARSGNRNVARELARELRCEYFFAPCYLNLAKGAGIERASAGENTFGLHGNAILSRLPLANLRTVRLPSPIDKMRGREKRLGEQRALIASIGAGSAALQVACIHLDQRSTPTQRAAQMHRVLQGIDADLPAVLGGDWNTSTYNTRHAMLSLRDFLLHLARGMERMVREHFTHPQQRFERPLFAALDTAGFDYARCNALGVGTAHYALRDASARKNLEEWIPGVLFRLLEWGTRSINGECSLKLDWFATRGAQIASPADPRSTRIGAATSPQVIHDVSWNGQPVSDHDPIVVDVEM